VHRDSYLPEVRAQYEAYPFPLRRAEEEAQRLITSEPDLLSRIDHHCFGGRRDFREPFRVLVAGGGTGDALVFLGEQLRDVACELVYLDMSSSSMAIARARVEARGLENVTWVQGSILKIESLGLGTFDYINCIGVLHHLPDPAAGLRQLAGVLADKGGMGLMLYGHYGRRHVYTVQRILSLIDGGEPPLAERVQTARAALVDLNSAGILALEERVPSALDSAEFDTYLVDNYLHRQDQAFTAEGIHELLGGCGLHLGGFTNFFEEQGVVCPMDYEPALYLRNPELSQKVASRSLAERQHLAEILNNNISMHAFYVTKQPSAAAVVSDLTLAPYYPTSYAAEVARGVATDAAEPIEVHFHSGVQRSFELSPLGRAVLALVDGELSSQALCLAAVKASPGMGQQAAIRQVLSTLDLFRQLGLLLLRDPALPRLPVHEVSRSWSGSVDLRPR
jgi:SAM-dependent methyltransferase